MSTVELETLDFQEKQFVLTDIFHQARGREERNIVVRPCIEVEGGKCSDAVSGKTDYLVLGSLGGVGLKKVWQAR